MDNDGALRILEEAKRSFEKRTRWYHKLWRWAWNLCPLCEAKMDVRAGASGSVKTCSRCPNYRPSAEELNLVPLLLIAVILMAITIFALVMMLKDKKMREAGEIYHQPSISPRGGYFDGFNSEKPGLK